MPREESSRRLPPGMPTSGHVAIACALAFCACGGKADEHGGTAGSHSGGGAQAGTDGNVSGGTSGGAASSVASGGSGAVGGTIAPGDEFVPVTFDELSQLTRDACVGSTSEVEYLPDYMLVLTETAETMNARAIGSSSTDLTWVREGLASTFQSWTGFQSIALSFFPNRRTAPNRVEPLPSSACIDTSLDVPFLAASSPNRTAALHDGIFSAVTMGRGGAPLRDAYAAAVSALPSSTWIAKEIVLLTDGQPTLDAGCFGDDDPLSPESLADFVTDVAEARAHDIRTLIIGTPTSARTSAGNDVRPSLSRAAREGGFENAGCSDDGPNYCHVDLSTASNPSDAIVAAFERFRPPSNAICTYELPNAPEGLQLDAERAVLTFDTPEQTFLIAHNQSATCDAGWQLTANNEIRLCDATCEHLKTLLVVGNSLAMPCLPEKP